MELHGDLPSMPLAGPRNRQENDGKKNMERKMGSKEEKGQGKGEK